jgi:hypothetical protein
MTMRLRCSFLVVLAGLLLTAPAVGAKPRIKKTTRLHAFGSCTSLLGYARRHAIRVVNDTTVVARPIPVGAPVPGAGGDGGAVPPTAAPAPAPAPQAGERTDTNSTTNVQEAGVDEPDIVKSAGDLVYTVAGGKLQAIDAGGAQPRMLGSLDLPGYDHQLLIHGSRALVISREATGGPVPLPEGVAVAAIAPPIRWLTSTKLTEVDLSDPGALRVVRTLSVEGEYVSARLANGFARVVVSSSPRGLIMPDVQPSEPAAQVKRAWRGSVRRTRAASWLPAMVLRRANGTRTRRALVRCRSVRRPRLFSGLDMISVLTIDMDKGLPAVDVDSLMSDGETVYASPGRLYVASERWLGEDPTRRESVSESLTAVHAFDTTKPGETRYVGSGEVPGYVLSQWALSEKDGILRIATTDQPPWNPDSGPGTTHSAVRTLEERDGRLVQIGALGGLGEGERIFAVRYIGDTAFVVTFRQTDPLFTIDLTNPRAPRLVGELQVPGYSAYLHPVGDGLLLGVGRQGPSVQLSLFDVSDLAHPQRLSRQTLGDDSWSEVENDHHAFLWWEPEHLAVIPAVVWGDEQQEFGGSVGFRVTRGGGVDTAAQWAHPFSDGSAFQFRRALVVGGRLLLLADDGVMAAPLSSLAPGAFVPFPAG